MWRSQQQSAGAGNKEATENSTNGWWSLAESEKEERWEHSWEVGTM